MWWIKGEKDCQENENMQNEDMYRFATRRGVLLKPTQESPPSKPNGKVDNQVEQGHLEANDKPLWSCNVARCVIHGCHARGEIGHAASQCAKVR